MAEPEIKINTDAMIDDTQSNPKKAVAAPMPGAGYQSQILNTQQSQAGYAQGASQPQAPQQPARPATSNWGNPPSAGPAQQGKVPKGRVTGVVIDDPKAKEAVEGFAQSIIDKGMAFLPVKGPWKAAAMGVSGFVVVPAFKDFPILLILCLIQLGCCCCSILSGTWKIKLLLALLGLIFSCAARVMRTKNIKAFKILRVLAWLMVIGGFLSSTITTIIGLITGAGQK